MRTSIFISNAYSFEETAFEETLARRLFFARSCPLFMFANLGEGYARDDQGVRTASNRYNNNGAMNVGRDRPHNLNRFGPQCIVLRLSLIHI